MSSDIAGSVRRQSIGAHRPTHPDSKRFAAGPMARLAALRPDGQPHVVAIVLALVGDIERQPQPVLALLLYVGAVSPQRAVAWGGPESAFMCDEPSAGCAGIGDSGCYCRRVLESMGACRRLLQAQLSLTQPRF